MTRFTPNFPRSPILRGSSIALIEQDRFIADYLQAALERHGAVVTALAGGADEIIDLLLSSSPPPSAAVLNAKLSQDGHLTTVLTRLEMPFVMISEGSPPAAGRPPAVPSWRWPFGAFQVVTALAEVIEASVHRHDPPHRKAP